jgi:hypothetical protein
MPTHDPGILPARRAQAIVPRHHQVPTQAASTIMVKSSPSHTNDQKTLARSHNTRARATPPQGQGFVAHLAGWAAPRLPKNWTGAPTARSPSPSTNAPHPSGRAMWATSRSKPARTTSSPSRTHSSAQGAVSTSFLSRLALFFLLSSFYSASVRQPQGFRCPAPAHPAGHRR